MKSNYGFIGILLTLMLAFSNSNYLHAQEAAVVDTPAVEIREVEAPPEAVSGDAPMLLRDDELDSLLNEPVNSRAVVGPLVQQKWNQYAPYNDLFPLIRGHPKDDGTGRLYTNCTNTAWAQIMAFHRHPARGSGQSTIVGPNHNVTVSSVNLNVAYDWNNMLNSYRRDGRNSNERQRNAVAVLMYHVALAVGAQGNYYTAMTETFGYDRSIQRHERIFYTDAGWEALIRSQLDAGLPVYYSAGRDGGGHGFVVDGYDNQGKFHVNWGWGGGHDGWYSLNALTPGSRNYYLRHAITANIRPNQRSTGSHEMGIKGFTVNKTAIQQNELFTVTANVTSFGFFSGGQVGAAVVNSRGAITSIVGIANYGERRPGSSLTRTMNCFLPETASTGIGNLRIVTRETGGEWKIATTSAVGDGVPSSISLTVTAGTVTPGGGYGLALTAFSASKNTAAQNEFFTVTMVPRNVGLEQFPGGQVGAALVGTNGRIAEVIGIRNRSALNSGSLSGALEINCHVPETVRAGQYRLMAVVRTEGGQWRVATLALPDISNSIDFNVTAETITPGGGYGLALTNFSASRNAAVQNEMFAVSIVPRNIGLAQFPGGQVGAALVGTNGRIVEVVGFRNRNALNAGSLSGVLEFNCYVPETVRAGQYRLMAVVRTEGGQWRIATLSLPDVPNSINFTVTAEPGTTGGGYGLALTTFSASRTSIPQNEFFTVAVAPRNIGLEQFPGGQVGAALVDNSGRLSAVIGIANRNALNAGSSSGTITINCYVPETVRAGQYRLMAVIRPTGGEWRIATLALPDVPNSFNFTVTAQTIAQGGGYGLALTAFSANKTAVMQNELFAVTMTPRNAGLENFPGGQVGAALVEASGRIVEVIGIRNRGALNAGSTSGALEFNCFVPETVRAGQYRLMAVVRPDGGQWRIATLALPDIPNSINFTVNAERGTTGGGYGLALTSFASSMTSMRQNERFAVTTAPRNVGMNLFTGGQVGAALVDNNGRIVEVIGTANRNSLNAGSTSGNITINSTVPDTVRPGQYQLRIVVRPTGGEWRIATLALPNIPTVINITVR
ncbi:MAG: C10 family peptidase [Treponema sp.]|nr:C10 family peptidase [Treponema sp.]MCL2237343.1 C10 family peptidase [Treponema sp.]